MTAQASDSVQYLGAQHSLSAFSAGQPFDPAASGYRPVMASTACWRGYVCGYEVVEDSLRLARLRINHQATGDRASLALRPPPLAGVTAVVARDNLAGRWEFVNVGLPLPYSGGLVATRYLIPELSLRLGFQPAWKYEHVHELLFEEGRLVEARDLGSRMASIRDRAIAEEASHETIAAWMRTCFRLDYARRR